jgi:hypothetical protein
MTWTGPLQCSDCYAEFQIDRIPIGEGKFVLTFTSWHDLGEGRAPFDPKWVRRFLSGTNRSLPAATFEKGSIKAAYEEESKKDHISPSTGEASTVERAL